VPARGFATRSRAASGIISPVLRPVREVLSLDWDRKGRVTPAWTASQEAIICLLTISINHGNILPH